MGFDDSQFSRLQFTQKPGQPPFTNTVVNNAGSFGTTTGTNSSGKGVLF
jgi:hypothetical protein